MSPDIAVNRTGAIVADNHTEIDRLQLEDIIALDEPISALRVRSGTSRLAGDDYPMAHVDVRTYTESPNET